MKEGYPYYCVVHAHWIWEDATDKDRKCYDIKENEEAKRARCSNCFEFRIITNLPEKYLRHCPCCGAKMDEESENTT